LAEEHGFRMLQKWSFNCTDWYFTVKGSTRLCKKE
jgi:hypothetical protein